MAVERDPEAVLTELGLAIRQKATDAALQQMRDKSLYGFTAVGSNGERIDPKWLVPYSPDSQLARDIQQSKKEAKAKAKATADDEPLTGKTIEQVEDHPPSSYDGKPDQSRIVLYFTDGTMVELIGEGDD